MEVVNDFLHDYPNVRYYLAGAATLGTVYIVWKQKHSRKTSVPSVVVPEGTVVLHQLPRGPFAPSFSPFPIKLEMFLRLAKIPYVNDFKSPMSAKGKTPWMTYNGEDVADSQICIQHLVNKVGVDVNKGLSLEQKAVARAFQVMVDEHLYWTLAIFRWFEKGGLNLLLQFIQIPSFALWFFKRKVKAQTLGQGMGRHTAEQVYTFMIDDLTQLENFLGDKKFMMGNEPTEVDCSMFGMLCQLVFHQTDDTLKDLVKDKFPKLHAYVERVKTTVWPDWEEVTSKVQRSKKL